MSDRSDGANGDPTTAPFWQGCRERRFLVQRCSDCGRHQFYPRPFCLACESFAVTWVEAKGTGRIYSMTTIRVLVDPALPPPYVVAIVELDEGPRVLSNLEGDKAAIGDRVVLRWRERDPLPPLPIFTRAEDR